METDEVLEKVKAYATAAHDGQKRKYTPEPYIVHPIRVMELCREHTQDTCILSAALLHDVLEDTPVSKAEMLAFLEGIMKEHDAKRTVRLVVELTDVYIKKDYPASNRRKRKEMERARISRTSADSQTIKYADIIDNCREIAVNDPDFARVFLNECRVLLKIIPAGDRELYRLAKQMVDEALEKTRNTRSGR